MNYRKNVRNKETPVILVRMSHIAVDIWEDTMSAPGSYDLVSKYKNNFRCG
jgi:hypothetical protein